MDQISVKLLFLKVKFENCSMMRSKWLEFVNQNGLNLWIRATLKLQV